MILPTRLTINALKPTLHKWPKKFGHFFWSIFGDRAIFPAPFVGLEVRVLGQKVGQHMPPGERIVRFRCCLVGNGPKSAIYTKDKFTLCSI